MRSFILNEALHRAAEMRPDYASGEYRLPWRAAIPVMAGISLALWAVIAFGAWSLIHH